MIALLALSLTDAGNVYQEMVDMDRRIMAIEASIARIGGGSDSPRWPARDVSSRRFGRFILESQLADGLKSTQLIYTYSTLSGMPSSGASQGTKLGNHRVSMNSEIFYDTLQIASARRALLDHRETVRTTLVDGLVQFARDERLQFNESVYSFRFSLEEAREKDEGETVNIYFLLDGIPSGHLTGYVRNDGIVGVTLHPGVLSSIRHKPTITPEQAAIIARQNRIETIEPTYYDYEIVSLTYYDEQPIAFTEHYPHIPIRRLVPDTPAYRWEASPMYAVRRYTMEEGRPRLSWVEHVDAVTGQFLGGNWLFTIGPEHAADKLHISVKDERYDLQKGVPPVEPETTPGVIQLFGQKDTEVRISKDGRWVKFDFGWYQSVRTIPM